jgi:hypothetical protein
MHEVYRTLKDIQTVEIIEAHEPINKTRKEKERGIDRC